MQPSRERITSHGFLSLVAAVCLAVVALVGGPASAAPFPDSALDCKSEELKATEITATLDAPIKKGMNTIWCASFLAAWKTLEEDVAKEPIALQGGTKIAGVLNEAPDPRRYIPEPNLYTAAGWNDEGILEQIRRDLGAKFPGKAMPDFPDIAPFSFVAYGYLEANLKFSTPYLQSEQPLVFFDGADRKTHLSSFGIRPEDEHGLSQLRKQPAVLFSARDDDQRLTEYIVDLDRDSRPNQIVLALIEPKPTLDEMVETVYGKLHGFKRGIEPDGVLLVPDMVWRISHHFEELEGQRFANATLRKQPIHVAQQDIQFRLDRSGAELKSEAKMFSWGGGIAPAHYVFNRPFMLYMRKRGARMPYLVMWIDNAELLSKWQPGRKLR